MKSKISIDYKEEEPDYKEDLTRKKGRSSEETRIANVTKRKLSKLQSSNVENSKLRMTRKMQWIE